jgi:hypothetical protein
MESKALHITDLKRRFFMTCIKQVKNENRNRKLWKKGDLY